MKTSKLTIGALTLLTLATMVGCGQPGAFNAAPTGMSRLQANQPTVTVQGKKRKLGYDWNRYQTKLKRKAKPTKVPRQGLRPTKIDLRNLTAPVYDQGELGACTAFAIGKGMRELMQRKNGEAQTPLSALWLYYETRVKLGTVGEDSGGTITDGVAVLEEKGAAPDALWGYNIAQFKVKPAKEAYQAASEFKVDKAVQVAGLEDVKNTLAQGNPVAFGYMVYNSFTKIGKDGVMPMPKPGEKLLGGHAVLAVGYDEEKKALIVRNSWSANWGDEGYFYMPYAFVTDENAGDFWTAK